MTPLTYIKWILFCWLLLQRHFKYSHSGLELSISIRPVFPKLFQYADHEWQKCFPVDQKNIWWTFLGQFFLQQIATTNSQLLLFCSK